MQNTHISVPRNSVFLLLTDYKNVFISFSKAASLICHTCSVVCFATSPYNSQNVNIANEHNCKNQVTQTSYCKTEEIISGKWPSSFIAIPIFIVFDPIDFRVIPWIKYWLTRRRARRYLCRRRHMLFVARFLNEYRPISEIFHSNGAILVGIDQNKKVSNFDPQQP